MNTLPLDLLQYALAPLLDTRSLAAFICAHRSHRPCVVAYRPIREFVFQLARNGGNRVRNHGHRYLTSVQRARLWHRVDFEFMQKLRSGGFDRFTQWHPFLSANHPHNCWSNLQYMMVGIPIDVQLHELNSKSP